MSPSPATPHILIIEPNDRHYSLIRTQFKDHSAPSRVTRALDLKSGLEHLKSHRYDLVISEILPSAAGEPFVPQLKSAVRDVPVVILTSRSSQELAINALKQGADDYMIKQRKILNRLPHDLHALIRKRRTKKHHVFNRSLNPMNMLTRNMRHLAELINEPRTLLDGKKQLQRLEEELELIKAQFKKFIS